MGENTRSAQLQKLRRESAARRAQNVARETQLAFERMIEDARREYNLRVGHGIDQGFKRVKIRNEKATSAQVKLDRLSIHDLAQSNPALAAAIRAADRKIPY